MFSGIGRKNSAYHQYPYLPNYNLKFYRETTIHAMHDFTGLFLTPFSFAETSGAGRVNSPGMVNLALRAGIARQGGLVGSD
jgi:hypothetical protein